jgi:hypothetical protein
VGKLIHGRTTTYSYHGCRCELCKAVHSAYNKAYREENRERFRMQRRAEYANNPERFKRLVKARLDKHLRILQRYKLWSGCIVCGYKENARALEFHHRDPATKAFNVSERKGYAWKRTKDEVRKCDVICSNCHKIKEAEKWDA